jgi:RNA polymerase sigma factor (sigma-70 family)
MTNTERLEMLAPELKARRARKEASPSLEAEFYRLALPKLKSVARKFTASARGALDLEDLEQVGAVELFKLVDRYEPRPWHTFEFLLHGVAKRACLEQIRLRATSVHLTRAQRRAGLPAPRFTEPDALAASDDTPEAMYLHQETLQALRAGLCRLTPERRKLLSSLYGIARDRAQSLRDVSFLMRRDRMEVVTERDAALDALHWHLRGRRLRAIPRPAAPITKAARCCEVDDCELHAIARGLCRSHYGRIRDWQKSLEVGDEFRNDGWLDRGEPGEWRQMLDRFQERGAV